MKRLGSLALPAALSALGAVGCGANTTPGGNPPFAKFDVLADFEKSAAFNTNPLWAGSFAGDADKSDLKGQPFKPAGAEMLNPPRVADGTMSMGGFHAADTGLHTFWGTVIYADLQSLHKPVDLSQYTGFSLWARSAGMPGTTVKVGFADVFSFDYGQTGAYPDPTTGQICNTIDTTPGGLGCFDDYAAKIYPDGQWRRYDIPFSSLATGGWGIVHAFDQTRVIRIKISMLPTTKYDLWFDDFVFYTN